MDERLEQRAALRNHEVGERAAGHVLGRPLEQPGEAAVAIEDAAVGGQADRPLPHPFDHQQVRAIGALERIDLVAPVLLDDQRVHLPLADGAQRLLRLLQPVAQLLVLAQQAVTPLYRHRRTSRIQG